jgi:PhnB protein
MARNPARKKLPTKKSLPKKAAARRKGRRKVNAVPKGYQSVIPYLAVRDGAAALDFYQEVFGARKLQEYRPGGRLAHAELKIGDAYLMLSEADPKQEFNAPKPGQVTDSTMIYLDDVDEVVERAVHAGARLVTPVVDMPFGDRSGTIVDPFDHRWMVSTHIEDVSPKEAERRMKSAGMG